MEQVRSGPVPSIYVFCNPGQVTLPGSSSVCSCCFRQAKPCLTIATMWTVTHQLLCPWDFPGKNAGVGYHFLLQGIFPTQRLNSCLLHWQMDSLSLNHKGSPSFSLLINKMWGRILPNRLFYGDVKLMYGEGNGSPLQCSCLESTMDGGARWAAVHGVAGIGHD